LAETDFFSLPPHTSRLILGFTQPPYPMHTRDSLPWDKVAGA